MILYNIDPILITAKDFDLGALKKELGQGQVVVHDGEANAREVRISVSLSSDGLQYGIVSGVVDETLITGPVTAETLTQDIIDAHDRMAIIVARDKVGRIAGLKNQMNAEIYAEVFTYFGTTDREAASAWSTSWQLKAGSASDYRDSDLKVIHPTSSFVTPGEALTVYSDAPTNTVIDNAATDTKIQDYFTELIDEILKPFDKLRDQKVATFLTEKAIIDAE